MSISTRNAARQAVSPQFRLKDNGDSFNRHKSVFRYPGAKGRYLQQILPLLRPTTTKFHDVFVGGGSVMLAYAARCRQCKISVNDLDEHIFAFWQLLSEPESTINELFKLLDQTPTVELFIQVIPFLIR